MGVLPKARCAAKNTVSGVASCTLVRRSKGKPSYVNAAPAPVKPKGNGERFTKIGKNRWAYGVVFTENLHGHSTWSFGVKVGKKTTIVRVTVKR